MNFRSDEQFAKETFEILLPEETPRRLFMEFFAHSITQAHALAPDRWGITLYPNLVRMNFGMIEVLRAIPYWLLIRLDQGTLPTFPPSLNPAEMVGIENEGFKNVPDAVRCYFHINQTKNVLPVIQSSHRILLDKASKTARHNGTAKAHSPGVIYHLSSSLGVSLPQPAYFAPEQSKVAELPLPDALPLVEEMGKPQQYAEGTVKQILETAYERDPKAREACLNHYGRRCIVCGLSFEEKYGSVGKGYIHVHHLTPLSTPGRDLHTNPVQDLRPVCPNCHAVIHLNTPPYTPEEVKQMIEAASQQNRQQHG